ncbi:MAG TPA: tRNA uridine-5-carboxymethylaminomethyl(34) synthesis GTPase MnmE, partial [Terriglobia bacterium]|nr:tRNA uridine-5-carboxymethylaminomethyl(34) synthesis GTPase MnmE [Terriglobia bacterium]
MSHHDETIVAIATPPGRGGLGVVRLSGGQALEIATGILRLPKTALEPRQATLAEFCDPSTGRVLDQVLASFFPGPHSYTGEDVLEVSCHGSPVILAFLVELCLARGARPAEPGEFTLRAFLNGRMDLTQAEAIRDLIESRTLFQARVAAGQMEGAVSQRLKPHKEALVELIARLEAGIDFAEDDVPVSGWEEIAAAVDAIQRDLSRLVETYELGKIVREGLTLAIVGRPNVGKSSLFNRLLNQERAIVTAMPGTTRDLISETASLDGIPLRLVDTAGIREAHDEAERLGVAKSLQAIADSSLRLFVVDASEGWTELDEQLWAKVLPLGSLTVALNKTDLPARLNRHELAARLIHGEKALPAATAFEGTLSHTVVGVEAPGATAVVEVSALTGHGIEDLKQALLSIAAPARETAEPGEIITNLRHQQLIQTALAALGRAHHATASRVHHEMLLLDLYEALHALDLITGATTAEDVLGVIFST